LRKYGNQLQSVSSADSFVLFVSLVVHCAFTTKNTKRTKSTGKTRHRFCETTHEEKKGNGPSVLKTGCLRFIGHRRMAAERASKA